MSQLRVKLFGQCTLHYGDRPVADLSTKAQELLCYLFLNRDRAHTREALAETLWSGIAAERAHKYFRQALWQLQVALDAGPDSAPAPNRTVITLNPGWLRINQAADWWLDIAVLEHAYALCQRADGACPDEAQFRALQAAAELYEGDLLETWHHNWCLYERDRLQLAYLVILDTLMSHCEARQSYAEGLAYGQRALRYDPARERTYQLLMRLYYLAGERTTALREFESCAAALAREFDIAPSQQTLQLRDLIRADLRKCVEAIDVRPGVLRQRQIGAHKTPCALAGTTVTGQTDDCCTTPAPPTAPDGDLCAQIARLQASIVALQSQVQNELHSLARLLQHDVPPSEERRTKGHDGRRDG